MKNKSFKELDKLYKSLGNIDKDYRNSNLNNFLLKLIKKHKKGGKILDVGAGSGHLIHILRNNNFDVTGIEPNKDQIKYANKLYGIGDKIINMKIENIENLREKFDVITLIDTLEHIKDDQKALKKLKKLLNKNGIILILVPAYQSLFCQRDKKIGHFRRYNKKALRKLIKQTGGKTIYSRYWNMLGVPIYFVTGKLLKMDINSSVRNKPKGILKKILFKWFEKIENKINLGFGLSIITINRY
ncbi:methyltransferase domain-containing protein [Candidatus Peregrinibacteria bacterium]|nr:methyltransferase domain-containing protein [Candidatus Peregrinibacteria bacterium]